MSIVSDNLALVTAQVAASAGGREVTLVAVSKTHPVEAVQEAIKAGQRVFGENRVQEAKSKFATLKTQHPDLELHLIGALQTNKVAEAVALFDVIETVDRPKLAQALATECRRQGRFPRLFVEVNVGEEPQKAGVFPQDVAGFVAACQKDWGLRIDGLMCIPPQGKDSRAAFLLLQRLAAACGVPCLSMGMSGDFEQALTCGATHVRVGTAIFGQRAVLPSSPQK